jgi:predicted PurR-regulated permease PerM
MAAPNPQARINRWVALLGVTAVTVYLSWKVLEPFVGVLILGIALAVIFRPVHRRFVRWTGGNRRGAVLSTLFTILVLVVPFTFVSITVGKEVPGALRELDAGWKDLQQRWSASAESGSFLGSIREKLHFEEDPFSPENIKEYTTQ